MPTQTLTVPSDTAPNLTERVAKVLGVDLTRACPVCETADGCACDEEERTFARRVRHGIEGVARCSRLTCRAPLATLYLPRAGAPEKDRRLIHYAAVRLCALCQGDAMAAVMWALHEGEQ